MIQVTLAGKSYPRCDDRDGFTYLGNMVNLGGASERASGATKKGRMA
jgi:hypothetical protein